MLASRPLWPAVLCAVGACIARGVALAENPFLALVGMSVAWVLGGFTLGYIYAFFHGLISDGDTRKRYARAITPIGELAKTIGGFNSHQLEVIQSITANEEDMNFEEPDEAFVYINRIPVPLRIIREMRTGMEPTKNPNQRWLPAQNHYSDSKARDYYKLIYKLQLYNGNLIPASGNKPGLIKDYKEFDKIIQREHERCLDAKQWRALEVLNEEDGK